MLHVFRAWLKTHWTLLILKIGRYALGSVNSWMGSSKSFTILCYCASWCSFNLLNRHGVWVDEAMATFHMKNHKSSSYLLSLVPNKVVYNVMYTTSDPWIYSNDFLHSYFATRLLSKPPSKMNRNCTIGFLQACFLPNYFLKYSEDWGRYFYWNIGVSKQNSKLTASVLLTEIFVENIWLHNYGCTSVLMGQSRFFPCPCCSRQVLSQVSNIYRVWASMLWS